MIAALLMFMLRLAGFRCASCGELTIERDDQGVLRCFECRMKLEALAGRDPDSPNPPSGDTYAPN